MNAIRTIIKNTGALALMNFVTMVLGLIFTISLARFFGVIEFGKYSFAVAFTVLFAILTDLGLNQLMVREVSRNRNLANKYMGNILVMKFFLSLVYFGLIFAVVNLMDYPSDTKVIIYIFGCYTVLYSFGRLFGSMFRAYEKMEYTSLLTIIEKGIVVSIGLILLFLGYSLIKVISVYLIGGIIFFLFGLILTTKKIAKPKLQVDIPFLKHLVISAIPFAIFNIFLVINNKIDIVMLSTIEGNAVVGWYNAAYTLIFALCFIPISFIGALFPLFSRLATKQKNSLKFGYNKSFMYLLILAMPIVTGTIILADRIILFLYGEMFIRSIIVLQILILSIIPIFLHHVLGSVILAIDKERYAIVMWGICATVNVLLNLVLIPCFSYIGASFTTLLSETILFILLFYFVSKHLHYIPSYKMSKKPLVACLLMGTFLLSFKDFNLFITIIIAACIYFGLLLIMRAFSKEDIKLFQQIFIKNR